MEMKPNTDLITIDDNINKIQLLLKELVLEPRLKALEWSNITKQTPNMKIGYPGQHLASVITGIEGARTGARGDDLKDGTEVKSCSRVDQLDTCTNCKNKVLRIETNCAHCGSNKIKRMDDSKWLFSVKTEQELKLLTNDIDRIFITIADYPNFSDDDFETIRFQEFELWNNSDRNKHFKTLMTNYYYKIFLEHIKLNPSKTPAPKNFWPYSYQFYLCNPIKVFNCIITEANTNPSINIDFYVPPQTDRNNLESAKRPIQLLSSAELKIIIDNINPSIIEPQLTSGTIDDLRKVIDAKKLDRKELKSILPYINEETRSYFELRDTDIISTSTSSYVRR